MKSLFSILFILLSIAFYAQDSAYYNHSSKFNSVRELSKSLESNKSDLDIAKDYEKVARDFAVKKEYAKAEDYYQRAKKLYQKLKNTTKVTEIDREIAKMQEAQDKISEAIVSYRAAGSMAKDESVKEININDANRLMNNSNPQAQSGYIQQNINILSKTDKRKERAVAYQQMAQNNIALNQKEEAIENLGKALSDVQDTPPEAIEIKKEIASLYVEDNQIDKAISINKELIKEAQRANDSKTEIEQLQTLSSNYLQVNEKEKAEQTLREAYDIALEKGHTIDAKSSLELLTSQYTKDKKYQEALALYADFIDRLETLIKSDSTLIDSQAFKIQEERISQLENEKVLKDELIRKQDAINYILLASILLISLFLIFISRTLYSIKKKNKKIALQSLRREMNPHFIFNSLNSVNQFIAQNKELEANKFLSSYSKLMRNVMENSNKDFVALSTEMEQLREYLDLEHLRFGDKFDYEIKVEDSIDIESVYIPNMLIQPQLENAIWHGLRYKEDKGLLLLCITLDNKFLNITVEDNGIGLKKSKELKTKHQQKHNSRGMTNTLERIALLNDLYGINITMEIKEKDIPYTGVIVSFNFPLLDKNK